MSSHLGDGTFGSGTFGDPGAGAPNTNPLNLRVTARTTLTATVSWDAQTCDGYRFFKNGQAMSTSYDGSRTSAKFSVQPGDTVRVVPLKFLPGAQVGI